VYARQQQSEDDEPATVCDLGDPQNGIPPSGCGRIVCVESNGSGGQTTCFDT
jgi:hypothetical protein